MVCIFVNDSHFTYDIFNDLGSKGLYCRLAANDKKTIDFYLKLGFHTISLTNSIATNDDIYVGRII